MFRATAPGPYDAIVAKATDENLTAEDWGAIMEMCDKVTGDPSGPKESVQSIIRRMAHRNANVQLYTLELANSIAENCGKPVHRELASRAFTEALLKLANDRNTHQQVKSKILERMKYWSDMFKEDTDLGIMNDAFQRLKLNNPAIQAPSAPQKNSLTDVDRQKEEEELQMALKLSLQEEDRKKKGVTRPTVGASSSGAGPSGSGGAAATASGGGEESSAAAAPLQPMSSGTTAATVSRVRALYDFVPSEAGELEFKKGDVIAVLESVYKDWWRGSLKGKTGIFPLNYVEKLTDPTPDELAREAQMEAEVFAEIKNVEKLLTLLSASNTSGREEDNEEIGKLYHQTLAIRPKLIKLIEKYSQKKDDFTQLNEKFIKARRDYEALLESSMSQRPQPTYGQYAPRPFNDVPNYAQQRPQQPYFPQQQDPQYPPTSSSPNFQRPGPGGAPFYMAGAEVPAQGGPQGPSQGYQPRDQPSRVGSGGPPNTATPGPGPGRQPAPINTSPPPNTGYLPYAQPVAGGPIPSQPPPGPIPHGIRPQSTYGHPQELATSAYDSPVATNHPASAATYSSSVYSQDQVDPYSTASPVAGGPPAPGNSLYQIPPLPTAGAPPIPGSAPPSAPPASYDPYDGGYDSSSVVSGAPPPPVPTAGAPPIPGSVGRVISPPPLQPSGPAYDARQTLPSQRTYAPYVPPGGGPPDLAPSAPPAQGGAEGYYRGQGQGQTLY